MTKKPLTPQAIALLAKYGLSYANFPRAQQLIFTRGEYISRADEALTHLYFVISGKVKILLSLSDGKQLQLGHFISHGIIGDIELMAAKQTIQAAVQAVTDFECIALPLNHYRSTLKSNINFINHIGEELATKLIGRAINGAITTLQPLETRLAAYIYQTAIDNHFTEPLTEVAPMVGASYRHLLRCVNQLCKQGILFKEKKAYRITNRQALEAMTNDLYIF